MRREVSGFGLSAVLLVCGFSAAFLDSEVRAGSGRDPRLQPFSNASFWNTPLGKGASFQDPQETETAMIRNESVGGHAASYAWIGVDLLKIDRQKADDPVMRWEYKGRSSTGPWLSSSPVNGGSFELKTPHNIQFLGGTDRYAAIITEDGHYAYEVWKGSYDPTANVYRAHYVVLTDLYGLGKASRDGASEGIRAFGGSLLGGLIRCHELEQGVIPHAMAMVISPTQLRRGATMAEQKVWPATATDLGGRNTYSGNVPMGALFAIPQSVDLTKLDLSPEGMALARAYATFGGYVVDAAARTNIIAVTETGCNKAQTDNLQRDKRKILAQLRMVTNNGPDSIGGPGERVAPRPSELQPLH
ncbi:MULTISPECIES: hypothetical protein [Bradyrhizobium]|uniref:hypothetical protein n=1 Tax=Bradyrhizobium TaxID=374 RepID=UPI000425EB9A|nr:MULTISPECIES: hypothetical protein [Bradyrhizobium]QOG22158.1 hypothetical protein FOM02_37545 [Bradyrhizobium sp. SEMIA]UFW51624.1 hypothetical protein BaraCB756_11895 [Bradyrhizobium arachidis]